ncbi:MAG: putative Ig domain-containing protein [Acidobacteriota bacterium]
MNRKWILGALCFALQAPVWAQNFAITTPCPLPQGTVGVNYETQLETANGKSPVQFAYLEGLLPPGLTFTAAGGLFGVPQAQGTLTFTIRATDGNNTVLTKACSITMLPASANPLAIQTSCPLPQAPTNQPYSTTLLASGGVQPYVWTLASGQLPGGFFLSANGALSGTASVNSTYNFVLSVVDNSGQQALRQCSLITAPGGGSTFALSSINPNQAVQGAPALTITLLGSGFNSNSVVVWNFGTVNQLALTTTFIDPGTVRAAVPASLLTSSGSFPVAVRRTILTSPDFTNSLPFSVTGGLSIKSPCPLPSAAQQVAYRYVLTAEGGVVPYSWSIAAGSLPQGITLNGNGEIAGSATAAGQSTFTLRVTDAQQNTTTTPCSLRVNGPFEVKPGFLSFTTTQGISPVAQELSVTSGAGTVPVNALVPSTSWLRVTLSNASTPLRVRVDVDSAAMAPGTYNGLITVSAVGASNGPIGIPVVLQINAPLLTQMQVRPRGLSFRVPSGAAQPLYRHLTVSNAGAGTFNYQISVTPVSGGSWLTVLESTGTVTPTQPAYSLLQASPSGLPSGTYVSRVTVSGPPGSAPTSLLASLSISNGPDRLGTSTSAMSFRGVAGASIPPAQDLDVLSLGANPLIWQSASGGGAGIGNFLRVTPASETARTTLPSRVQISADTSGLAAGLYSGVLRISTGADNSPRLVAAHLRLLAQGQQPGLHAAPGGLLFVSQQGAGDPPPQSITLTNPGDAAATLDLAISGDTRPFRLPAQPPLSLAAGEQQPIAISIATAGLAAGVYEGGVVASLGGDAQVVIVPLRLVLTPGGGCVRTSLSLAPLQPVTGFLAMTGSGLSVRTRVVDNCGAAMTVGAVTARLASPDGAQNSLTHIGEGIWVGDVSVPSGLANNQLRLDLQATSTGAVLKANAVIYGAADDTITLPELADDAVLSTSTFQPGQPIAPGGLVAAFGVGLADRTASAFPPAQALGGAFAFFASPSTGLAPLPLFFASPGQLNGEVPRDLLPGVARQMIVQRGGQISRPVDVVLAATQPGIFTVNQQGTGQGAILDGSTTAELGRAVLAAPGTPVGRGRVISIYCEGLGRVNPEVANGTLAPSAEPLSRVVNAVTANIGGQTAQILYAGLAPGFVGLYQVNVLVPDNAQLGDAVPVTVTVNGATSNTATIAIR